jgi:hypothetical protein
MNINLILAFSLSVIIPGVIAAIRLRKIDAAYYPFLCILMFGVINELITFYLVKHGKSNAVNNNCYYLIEGLLIVYQFKRWELEPRIKYLYPLLFTSFSAFWLAEAFVFSHIGRFASYYIIFYSYVVVLLSITMTNKLLLTQRRTLLKNSVFLICIGFIVYFTNAILVEAFYLYGISASPTFQTAVVGIMAFINLLTNLLFALAVLWMPKKQKFSFSY